MIARTLKEADDDLKNAENQWAEAVFAYVHPEIIRQSRVERKTYTKGATDFIELWMDGEILLGRMTMRKDVDGMDIVCTTPTRRYGY